MKDLAEQLRKLIADSGLSLYRISKETGVPTTTLQRFVNRERDLTLGKASPLAEFFAVALRTRAEDCQ